MPKPLCPRDAWIVRLRTEALAVGTPAAAKVATVGLWIATYASDAGQKAFPGTQALAVLTGYTPQTVHRATKVLEAIGLLGRHLRMNASPLYSLLLPEAPSDWDRHMERFTDVTQRRVDPARKSA
ncbi:helix-turn-helix domain-containing protein [Streptacidiphilus sp. N1-12]|uniref:Helix-turn-helix domain-containing protein n=2 Tax=Streptacidiphilus alkalitolerans TaxID=3342712 RepID=A0ABV6WFC0_9ACTN